MANLFRGFGAVFYKEALHVRRDAGTLFFSLTMPLLQMFLLGFAIDTNIRDVSTVVLDQCNTTESRQLIQRFKNSTSFRILDTPVYTDEELTRAIVAGQAARFHAAPPASP